MKLIRIAFVMIALLCRHNSYAQHDPQAILANYVREMGKVMSPEVGKTYFLHFAMQNLFRSNDNALNNIDIKAYLNSQKMLIKSNLVDTYADKDDVISIVSASKHIIWQDGFGANDNVANREKLLNAQLELIKQATVITNNQKNDIMYIDLSPGEQIRESLHIQKMRVSYNIKTERIQAIEIAYNERSKIEKQIVKYLDVDFNCKKHLSQLSVRDQFFNNDDSLIKQYNEYTLINNKTVDKP